MAGSVRERSQDVAMLVVTLVCSDPDCAAEQEAWAPEPGELDRLMCDCGCALVALEYWEATPVRTSGRGRSRRRQLARSGR